jgi:predicted phosphodiesterase
LADLPVNGQLLKLAEQFQTNQSLADHLGVPRTTLRDHIYRLGMQDSVNAVRRLPEVAQPDEIPIIYRDYSHQEKHYLYPLGDLHVGARMHNAEMWSKWLSYLEDREETSLLLTGDLLNSAILGSKSDVYEETMTVGEAKRLVRRQLSALAKEKRVDGAVPGNHEDRITRATGDCPIQDICDGLDIPYIRAAALLIYTVGDQTYEIFLRHGTGSGQALTALTKTQQVIRADVYIHGHIHNQAARVGDMFETKRGRVERRKFIAITSGSFLAYETYAAVRGYAPGHMGSPRVFLDGRRHDFHVSL